ncbi:HK97 gp10 family phage protein [Sphaerisporangium sp. NBC_01403]|uniref:HK97 gp10 family phage protein n=1 Tax=Sphaerisporangium sp. NBC_01403 TaxID=2903599 RepID=UPI0032528D38
MAVGDPAEEIRKLAKDLGKIPAELRKELRPELKKAAEPIATDARGRASWSARIPRAIAVSMHLNKRDPGVSIRVRASMAPHGRAYEGITGASHFVHPVHGHRDRTVSEETRPYVAPAVDAATDEVVDAVAQTVDRVAREQGFR